MKRILKSALVALLLLGATTDSQASHGRKIEGPNILPTLFGKYEGMFTGGGRTLPFKTFYLNVYPNGRVEGYLSGPDVGAYVTGTADRRGQFTAGFYYGDKYYTLTGSINGGTKKVFAIAKPYRRNNTVGVVNGSLSRRSYAPSSIADTEANVSGNDLDLYFDFYNDGTFGAYDYDSEDEFGGTFSYAKIGSNLARLTIIAGDETHTFLLYYFSSGTGVAYDVGTRTFHNFDDDTED